MGEGDEPKKGGTIIIIIIIALDNAPYKMLHKLKNITMKSMNDSHPKIKITCGFTACYFHITWIKTLSTSVSDDACPPIENSAFCDILNLCAAFHEHTFARENYVAAVCL